MYISLRKGLSSSWYNCESLMFFTQTKVHHSENDDLPRHPQVHVKHFIPVGTLV